MTAEIILKINQEIEYYFWLRKEACRDEVGIAQQLGHVQGMLAVLEILTGKKYRLTKGGVVPTVEKKTLKKSLIILKKCLTIYRVYDIIYVSGGTRIPTERRESQWTGTQKKPCKSC